MRWTRPYSSTSGKSRRRAEAFRAGYRSARALRRGQGPGVPPRAGGHHRKAAGRAGAPRRDRRCDRAGAGRSGDRPAGREGRGSRTAHQRAGIQGRRGLPEMARRIPRASVSAPTVTRLFQAAFRIVRIGAGDVVLRLLHTADWHLGRRFPSFPEEAQKKLSRARMDVVCEDPRRRATPRGECRAVRRRPVRRSEPGAGLLGRAGQDVPRPAGAACAAVLRSRQPRSADAGVRVGAAPSVSRAASRVGARRRPRRLHVRAHAGGGALRAAVPIEGGRERSGDGAARARARRYAAPHRLRARLHVRHRGIPDEFPHSPGCRRAARTGLSGHRRHAFVPRRHAGSAGADGISGRAGADELRRGRRGHGGARRVVPARAASPRRMRSRSRSGAGSTCGAAT